MAMIKMGTDYCPHCKGILDAVDSVLNEDYKPKPKDLTVCMYCSAILYYQDDMALGDFPRVLYETLDEETKFTLHKAQSALSLMWQERPEFKSKPELNKQEYGYLYDSQTQRH